MQYLEPLSSQFSSFVAALAIVKRSITFTMNSSTSHDRKNTFETKKELSMKALERTISMTLKRRIENTQRRRTQLLNLIKMLILNKMLILGQGSYSQMLNPSGVKSGDETSFELLISHLTSALSTREMSKFQRILALTEKTI